MSGFKGGNGKRKDSVPMEEEYATFTDANETLRLAALFPSLVFGVGVFVRHRDIRVC